MTSAVELAVVPAAGLGTRMLPATKCVPKELLPLGGRPLIHHIVDEGVEAGVTEFVFVVRPGDSRLLQYFRRAPELEGALPAAGPTREAYESTLFENVRFAAVEQREPRGLGDAVLCARDAVAGRDFAVMLPDMVFGPKESAQPALGGLGGAAGALLLMEVAPEEVSRYGIASVTRGGAGRIDGLVEKPATDAAPSNLAVAGRYAFTPELFGFLERTPAGAGGERQITDAIRALIAEGGQIRPVLLRAATCHDCGSPAGYAAACAAIAASPPRRAL